MGCSGIVSSFILNPLDTIRDREKNWKIILLSSFCFTANLATSIVSSKFPNDSYSISMPALSDVGFILGGILVGLGTKVRRISNF